jgi:hypothetical protein
MKQRKDTGLTRVFYACPASCISHVMPTTGSAVANVRAGDEELAIIEEHRRDSRKAGETRFYPSHRSHQRSSPVCMLYQLSSLDTANFKGPVKQRTLRWIHVGHVCSAWRLGYARLWATLVAAAGQPWDEFLQRAGLSPLSIQGCMTGGGDPGEEERLIMKYAHRAWTWGLHLAGLGVPALSTANRAAPDLRVSRLSAPDSDKPLPLSSHFICSVALRFRHLSMDNFIFPPGAQLLAPSVPFNCSYLFLAPCTCPPTVTVDMLGRSSWSVSVECPASRSWICPLPTLCSIRPLARTNPSQLFLTLYVSGWMFGR